jgi:hypothetical protein
MSIDCFALKEILNPNPDLEIYFLDYRFALGFQPREVSKKLSRFRWNDNMGI